MGDIESIIKSDDLKLIKHYIDYNELILEMLEKRNVKDEKLTKDLLRLIARHKEITEQVK